MLLSRSSNMLVITYKHDKHSTSLLASFECVCVSECVPLCVGGWKNAIAYCFMHYRSLFWFFFPLLLHHSVVFRKIVFYKPYRRIIPAVYPSLPTLPCIRTLGSHLYIFYLLGVLLCLFFTFIPAMMIFQCPSTSSCLNAEICIALLSSRVYRCLEGVTLQRFPRMLQHCTIQQTENPIYPVLNLVLHNFTGLYFHSNVTL